MRFIRGILLGTIAGALVGLILYLVQQRQRKIISLELHSVRRPGDPKPAGPAQPARARQQDDLKRIRGIGPVYARRLNEAGIRAFSELAGQSAEALAAITGAAGGAAVTKAWIAQARRLAAA